MNGISFSYYLKFDEKINQYLVFLVHIQQSQKISVKDQHKIFDFAKEISKDIASQTKKYFLNLTDYNILEKNNELEDRFNDIIKEINNEINHYKVVIDDKKLFRFEDIIETLILQNRNVYLMPVDISNLYFYKEFDRKKKIDEKSKKEREELEKNQEMELEEIKIKAFNNLINSKNKENKNPELFYKINKKIINEIPMEDIKYFEEYGDEGILKYGVYFIKNKKELIIIEKKDGVFIKYSINIIDMDTEFIIHIQGKIKIDEQEETFKIYERYINKRFEAVLNGYRLKQLIEMFNKLFLEKYRNEDHLGEKRNKIDDYLSGKIVR